MSLPLLVYPVHLVLRVPSGESIHLKHYPSPKHRRSIILTSGFLSRPTVILYASRHMPGTAQNLSTASSQRTTATCHANTYMKLAHGDIRDVTYHAHLRVSQPPECHPVRQPPQAWHCCQRKNCCCWVRDLRVHDAILNALCSAESTAYSMTQHRTAQHSTKAPAAAAGDEGHPSYMLGDAQL